jgi:flagellar P-ring protein precursor FlgI
VSIVQGSISITVSSEPVVSQPPALSQGTTVAQTTQNVAVTEEAGKSLKVESGVTVGQLASDLNSMGITPRDLVAILQAIKDAGAMSAELRIL